MKYRQYKEFTQPLHTVDFKRIITKVLTNELICIERGVNAPSRKIYCNINVLLSCYPLKHIMRVNLKMQDSQKLN